METRLRNRLVGAYGIYFRNVEGMMTAINTMMSKLKLDLDGQVSNPSVVIPLWTTILLQLV